MKAAVLERPATPLVVREISGPRPGHGEVLLKVDACGVCRTDLHIIDGELPPPKQPLVLGHQVVGRVVESGAGARGFRDGQRVGVPWLGGACGECRYCRGGYENLCDQARYTGFHIDGGFAEMCVADERFAVALPQECTPAKTAPLLCAGLIGYRAYKLTRCGEPDGSGGMTGPGTKRIGFYGFGSSASILIQVALHNGQEVYAFVRPGDTQGRDFALAMGAAWAGGSDERPARELDAAIIFAPVGELVPEALTAVRRGGVVVCAGIHMSDIPAFPYEKLWGERTLRSVSNLTRRDSQEFMNLAREISVKTEVTVYSLDEINRAVEDLRKGHIAGSAVVTVNGS